MQKNFWFCPYTKQLAILSDDDITYGALTPKLSNRQLYPFFYRIITPESSLNILKIAVLKHFDWDQIATINPPGDTFDSGTTDFRERADENGINVAVSEIFTIDPRLHVTNLKKLGVRIIIGNFYEEQARRVFCQAYKEGMYGGKYVWFTPGWYSPEWWRKRGPGEDLDCTPEQMEMAVNGYFGVSYVSLPKDADPTDRVSKMVINSGKKTVVIYS
ncbi:gamma-aminobutyric acid type B receptor subunit 1-like [Amphiura filiformis]|uniref:gamma-aminobutyric acid type B receptor subunit 1-like n=1 Tax=Amphiura filiformis TaxID=82378 RepID=UPI003B21027E